MLNESNLNFNRHQPTSRATTMPLQCRNPSCFTARRRHRDGGWSEMSLVTSERIVHILTCQICVLGSVVRALRSESISDSERLPILIQTVCFCSCQVVAKARQHFLNLRNPKHLFQVPSPTGRLGAIIQVTARLTASERLKFKPVACQCHCGPGLRA